MSTITTLNSGDTGAVSRVVINTNFTNLNTDKAELASPTFTGTPNLPTGTVAVTQASGDNSTKVATTAYINRDFSMGKKSVTAGATITGATLPVPVYQNDSDNEFYACDANDTAAMKFLAFAITNGTDGSAMTVQFTGIVPGFTGLIEGEKYYVSDTVGTIANTIGTYEILVGVAISETELLIQKGRRRAAGNGGSLGTATGSTVVTCGFRPSVIRLAASCTDSTHTSNMNAVWANGTLYAVTGYYNEATGGASSNNAIIYDNSNGTVYMTFTITTVTDTGFTIVWTETGAFPGGGEAYFLWEAEGEL